LSACQGKYREAVVAYERAADRYAWEVTGKPAAFASATCALLMLVTMDSHGSSTHDRVQDEAKARRAKILASLGASE
jgi:hypothetical protein